MCGINNQARRLNKLQDVIVFESTETSIRFWYMLSTMLEQGLAKITVHPIMCKQRVAHYVCPWDYRSKGFTIVVFYGGRKLASSVNNPFTKLKSHLKPVQEEACLNAMNILSGASHRADAGKTDKVTCQGDVMKLHCQSPRTMKIYSAEYSRKQNSICNRRNSAKYCGPVDKMSLLRKRCEGQMTCNVSVDRKTMGDNCPKAFKYLDVVYECSK